MRAADYIVDIGPGAGVNGGDIVARGSLKDIEKNNKSITGKYLSKKLFIDIPKVRRKKTSTLKITNARENNIKGIVIGNPVNMDGSKGPSAQSAKDFAEYLSNNISIPVSMWDERLSTEGAFNLSSNLDVNVSKKVEKLDQNAASFILQGAIDYIRR